MEQWSTQLCDSNKTVKFSDEIEELDTTHTNAVESFLDGIQSLLKL